jgi:hypothetical protein
MVRYLGPMQNCYFLSYIVVPTVKPLEWIRRRSIPFFVKSLRIASGLCDEVTSVTEGVDSAIGDPVRQSCNVGSVADR